MLLEWRGAWMVACRYSSSDDYQRDATRWRNKLRTESTKMQIRPVSIFSSLLLASLIVACAVIVGGLFALVNPAQAVPPYDVTITFDAPSTGPAPDSYNWYLNDCAVTGATGAAQSALLSGDTFAAALPADDTYDICVRSVNATGEQPDPGQVATITVADLPLSDPPDNVDVQVTCPVGGCTVTITVN